MFESEERRIAERIKDFIKKEESPMNVYIMLRNGHILNINNYRNMVSADKINPQDAYVYIGIDRALFRSAFYYPFLEWYTDLLDAYLSKLGFRYWLFVVSATGIKYVADAIYYGKYLTIEVSDLDVTVNSTNLRKIVFEVVGDKIISGEKKLTDEEYDKIRDILKSQRLFAGYNFVEAWNIIREYYDRRNKSLTKEVARITMDYVDIFHPYKVCYREGG